MLLQETCVSSLKQFSSKRPIARFMVLRCAKLKRTQNSKRNQLKLDYKEQRRFVSAPFKTFVFLPNWIIYNLRKKRGDPHWFPNLIYSWIQIKSSVAKERPKSATMADSAKYLVLIPKH